MEYSYRDELYHHGILGQRWGKRNGPPYPLDASDHSASEKKAGWKKSLAGGVDGKSNNSYNKKRLSSEQKKKLIKIGATVGIGILAAGVTYYAIKSGKIDGVLNKGKVAVTEYGGFSVDNEGYASANDLPLKHNDSFPDKVTKEWLQYDLANVNPDGGKHNCVACCVTEYLRSLGYDVSAKVRALQTVDGSGKSAERNFSVNEVEVLFSNFKMNDLDGSSAKSIKSQLLAQGEGAAGMVCGKFNSYLSEKAGIGGHAFSYRVLNGEVIFSDGQNKIFGDSILTQMLFACGSDGFQYGRFDDSKIDPDMISIFCN